MRNTTAIDRPWCVKRRTWLSSIATPRASIAARTASTLRPRWKYAKCSWSPSTEYVPSRDRRLAAVAAARSMYAGPWLIQSPPDSTTSGASAPRRAITAAT